jgi:hexosaminidase
LFTDNLFFFVHLQLQNLPMKNHIILIFIFLTMSCQAANLTDYLTPTPQKLTIHEADAIPYQSYQFLQIHNFLDQTRKNNFPVKTVFHHYGENIITLQYRTDSTLLPQHYQIRIQKQNISVVAGDDAGLFYATQTLRQIFTYALTENHAIPELAIDDFPTFAKRGYMLDISRDKVPKMQTLYQLIDDLASWKINEFQLYTEHTFAYKNHKEVWRNASPMTAAEVRALARYCAERFIDLVPNQNSFGHMENWLKYDNYLSLAECPDDCNTIWGTRKRSSLDPTNPASFILMKELYAELLRNFSSPYFNIGCDETVELGLGRSKVMCDSIGAGRVYLNYLKQLNDEVQKNGKTAQFWGDIIIHHDSLIPELPKNMIALVWGYDSKYPFDTILPKFQKAGIDFYVCPGTSSWRSIIGKQQIAYDNLYNAAYNGKKFGAKGMLITNWGDYGHWQPLSVCYPPTLLGASYAWNCDTNMMKRVEFLLNTYIFEDKTGKTGEAVSRLGNAYQLAQIPEGVANAFHLMLHRFAWTMQGNYQTRELKIENLQKAETEILAAQEILRQGKPECADAEIVQRELEQAVSLALHSIHLGIARLETPTGETLEIPYEKRKELAHELKKIIDNHKKLWTVRNRKGGLDDSAEKMEIIYDYYLTK